MLNIISRILLFITSYIPLYIILLVQYYDKNCKLFEQPLIFLLVCFTVLISILFGIFILFIKKQKQYSRTVELENIKLEREVSTTYILTNIVPLIAFDFTNKQQILSFLVLYVFLMAMYVKYRQIVYNPIIEIMGYTNYKCTMNGEDITILSKYKFSHTHTCEKVRVIRLDNDFFIVVDVITE